MHGPGRPARLGLAIAVVLFAGGAQAQDASADEGFVWPGAEWTVRSPEEAGLDPIALAALAEEVGGSGMVVKNGYRVHAWGEIDRPIDWSSASKPVVATCLWMAVEDGLCSLDATAGDFLDGGTEEDRAIPIRDLANMVSGYGLVEPSGEAWGYNDYGVNLLGEIVFAQAHGSQPSMVIPDRLAPLGFQDDVLVSDDERGRIKRMSIRDFARIGLLWLARGVWEDEPLLPESYFDLIANQVPDSLQRTAGEGEMSWDFGSFGGPRDQLAWGPGHYGFTFWVNTNDLWPGIPRDTYQANGHWGRVVCTCIPSLGLVAVGEGDWDHPSTDALRILAGSVTGVAGAETTWGEIKARFR
ncbi:MAG: serine hydrolase [Candidatus Eisenbacteria bacterium]|nr:serine hydrolase [Candidatus Latescibacterota bacterium]MBD3301890.1 serine hydrolase [Candidatus Eisenbacteria bacterium]